MVILMFCDFFVFLYTYHDHELDSKKKLDCKIQQNLQLLVLHEYFFLVMGNVFNKDYPVLWQLKHNWSPPTTLPQIPFLT